MQDFWDMTLCPTFRRNAVEYFPNLIRHVPAFGQPDPEDESTTILRIVENYLPSDAS